MKKVATLCSLVMITTAVHAQNICFDEKARPYDRAKACIETGNPYNATKAVRNSDYFTKLTIANQLSKNNPSNAMEIYLDLSPDMMGCGIESYLKNEQFLNAIKLQEKMNFNGHENYIQQKSTDDIRYNSATKLLAQKRPQNAFDIGWYISDSEKRMDLGCDFIKLGYEEIGEHLIRSLPKIQFENIKHRMIEKNLEKSVKLIENYYSQQFCY